MGTNARHPETGDESTSESQLAPTDSWHAHSEAYGDLGETRGWTKAEMDAALAGYDDLPLYQPGAATVATVEEVAEPPLTMFDWLYRTAGASESAAAAEDVPPAESVAEVPVTEVAMMELLSQPEQPRRRAGWVAPVLAGAACLAMIAGLSYGVTQVLPTASNTNPAQSAAPNTSVASQPSTQSLPLGATWTGKSALISGVSAAAECVAADAKDAAGATVTYGAEQAVDGDPATAWRCDGDATPTISFTIPEGTYISEIGLINGYTKIDPADKTDRYPLYRRVLEVKWTLPDGSTLTQELNDNTKTMQSIKVPVCVSGKVTLHVVRVTQPSSLAAARDAVVISEVKFSAPQA